MGRIALLFLLSGCAGEATAAAPEPRPAVGDAPLAVVVVSDLNGAYGATNYGDPVHAAVARVIELEPDLVLSTGDMVAGQRRGLDYTGMWASFHAAVTEPFAAAGIAFAITPGNHDGSGYPVFAEERREFVEQWAERAPDVVFVDRSGWPLRYSFTRGPALFVSLDATTIGPLDEPQMRWLEAQLEATTQPVKIVFGHVPLHPFTIGRESERIGDAALEAILRRHDVDLFISGHHHAYYPGRRGPLRLVSTACLGGGPRPLIGTEERSARAILAFEVGADGVANVDAFGGARLDERIEREGLPRFVGVGDERIERDDSFLKP